MKIPKSFKLFGLEINVVFEDNLYSLNGMIGQANYDLNQIRLQRSAEGFIINENKISSTFYHELAHYILMYSGQKEISDNEDTTSLIGNLLHQFFETAVYD